MKIENHAKCQIIFSFVMLLVFCTFTGAALANNHAEYVDECRNAANEGVRYFQPFDVPAELANEWRGKLEVTISDDSGGEILGMELEALNLSTHYQCTDNKTTPKNFSCNSLPVGASISGVHFLYKPAAPTGSTVTFVVKNADTGETLLKSDADVKFPPFPCSRNSSKKDLPAASGQKRVINTSGDCSDHKSFDFVETADRFALVNTISGYTLVGDRVKVEITPDVTYKYKLTLKFKTNSGLERDVVVEYDGNGGYTITQNDLHALGDAVLPLTFIGGTFTDDPTNTSHPKRTDFNIKFYYENENGTKGYENSMFHFERTLNVEFAPYCDNDTSKAPGVIAASYDYCLIDSQIFTVDLKDQAYALEIPRNSTVCGTKDYCESVSSYKSIPKNAPNDSTVYYFATRRCSNASCTSVATTSAYIQSITVSNSNVASKTYNAGGATGSTVSPIKMKLYNDYDTGKKLNITQARIVAHQPGTYVIYGFMSEKNAKKTTPTNYAVKFYITVPKSDSDSKCKSVANNGYFRAYWNDCLSYGETQLMPFEPIPGATQAWIRNDSYTGLHYYLSPEYSYVPQGLQIGSLTCKFASTTGGDPTKGYCNPEEIYIPAHTRVTITGGSIYLNEYPKYDNYRVGYLRESNMSISHLYFDVQVKECKKKMPDTGISLRSPLKVNESVDEATSYVFTGNSLSIPAIGLGSDPNIGPVPIVHVYYDDGPENLDWDLSTLGNYVGELEGGSYLPYAGNSVLTGHYYSAGIFKNLEYLNYGDEIIIYGNDGIKYVYHVVEKFISEPSDVYQMFQQVGERSLTLVTCENYNLATNEYERRYLVRAVIDHQEPYEMN